MTAALLAARVEKVVSVGDEKEGGGERRGPKN